MNIAIIDDTATDRLLLFHFLLRFMKENHIEQACNIQEFESGEDFFQCFPKTGFDLIFIDYYMMGMCGMDVAQKIRKIDTECALFFTTTCPDYAVESFLVKASGYLLKPYKYEHFCSLLKLCDIIKSFLSNPFVEYPYGKQTVRLLISDIIHCTTEGHYINIALKKQPLVHVRSTFDAIAAPLLQYPQFVVSCRGSLINMDHVKKIQDCDFVMCEGTLIPIAKKSKSEIISIYRKYIFTNYQK
ncbi:MAG: LytTR family DNA-binding domain-containing protein [Lachnospiraceae bacterium]|nr:LytTR family DNA-binding domain-containing protein [Lachnospiraceae bacterium]